MTTSSGLTPPRIDAPASVAAGAEVCFDVTVLSGTCSVLVEMEGVKLPVTLGGIDVLTSTYCVRAPAGSSGSTITITAVSTTGAVSTATIHVT